MSVRELAGNGVGLMFMGTAKWLLLCVVSVAVSGPAVSQNSAAELFDGLRYDMMQAAGGAVALSPDTRRKVDALAPVMDKITGAKPDKRAAYLKEFLTASAPLASELFDHPYGIGLLTLRTAALLELKRTDAAQESARQLLEAGATFSDGATVRQLLAVLERKGWLVTSQPGGARTVQNEPIPANSRRDAASSDAVAVYRIAPVYPGAAEALHLDGRVRVKFTVAADGTVKDARVAETACTIFDEAALTAISQWRYKPLTRNGVARERPDVQVVIAFKLPT